jgi:hypothetical protein
MTKPNDDKITVEHLIEAIPRMNWTRELNASTPLRFTEWVSMEAWQNPVSRLVVSMIRHDAKQRHRTARTTTFFEPWCDMLAEMFQRHSRDLERVPRPIDLIRLKMYAQRRL